MLLKSLEYSFKAKLDDNSRFQSAGLMLIKIKILK